MGGRQYTAVQDRHQTCQRSPTQGANTRRARHPENLGKAAPSATFEDLIKTPYDEALFAFYGEAQLVKNTAGTEVPIGKPGIHISVNLSPDKKYILLRKAVHPFSYLVPATRFPATIGIIGINGGEENSIATLLSGENSPRGFDNIQNAPRNFDWRDDRPSTLTWSSPLDGGLMRQKQDYHDAVYALDAPFTGGMTAGKELLRTQLRFQRIIWGNDSTALVFEVLRSKQTEHMSRLNPSTGKVTLLLERNTTDAYSDPGQPVLTRNQYGQEVLQTVDHGSRLLLNNPTGSSPKGDLPFLAKFDLATHQNKILWRCPEGQFEYISDVLDADKLILLSRKETHEQVPNYYIKSLGGGEKKSLGGREEKRRRRR